MTVLDGVNEILRKVGGYAVSVLDTGGSSSAAEAERCLNEASRKIQMIKWNFNTRNNVELTAGGDGTITLLAGTLYADSDGDDSWRNITHRGNKLYDLDNNTDQFTGSIHLELVELWEFHCVPEYVANYIATSAAVAFNSARGSRERDRQIYMEMDAAKRFAVAQNARQNDSNYLNTSDGRDIKGQRSETRDRSSYF